MINFMVSTQASNSSKTVAVDGQVENADLIFDHHRPGGALIQMDELPDKFSIDGDICFITPNLDEDAVISTAVLINGGQSELNSWMKDTLRETSLNCDQLTEPNDLYYHLKDLNYQLHLKLFKGKTELTEKELSKRYQLLVEAVLHFINHGTFKKIDSNFDGRFKKHLDKQRERLNESGFDLITGKIGFIDINRTGVVAPRIMYELARRNSVEILLIKYTKKKDMEGEIYTIGIDPMCQLDKDLLFTVFDKINAIDPLAKKQKWGGRSGVGGSPNSVGSLLEPVQIIDILKSTYSA